VFLPRRVATGAPARQHGRVDTDGTRRSRIWDFAKDPLLWVYLVVGVVLQTAAAQLIPDPGHGGHKPQSPPWCLRRTPLLAFAEGVIRFRFSVRIKVLNLWKRALCGYCADVGPCLNRGSG
jgi:hypothetical protein